MSGIARMRLKEERKQWRKEHRWGFYAKETLNEDGSKNIFKWEAGIPGKEKVPPRAWSTIGARSRVVC